MGKLAAILLCAAAALALAVSQAFVIFDAAAIRHPDWPPFALWALAAGVELAIVSAVLASALEGYTRPMIAVDVFLIALSVAISYGVVPALGLVPLAYSAVIVAAHRLHGRYHRKQAAKAGASKAKREKSEPAPESSRKRKASAGKVDWQEVLEQGLLDHCETNTEAAELLGVHPSTVGRNVQRNGKGWVGV